MDCEEKIVSELENGDGWNAFEKGRSLLDVQVAACLLVDGYLNQDTE